MSYRYLRLSEEPQLKPQLLKLVDEVFPKPQQSSTSLPRNSTELEFWRFFGAPSSEAPSEVFVATLNNQVVASVGVAKISPALKVSGIGIVCTHPNHQGKGLSTQLLRLAEAHAKSFHDSFLCVLWSDLEDFYIKKGYFPAGTEQHVNLRASESNALDSSLAGSLWQPVLAKDFSSIQWPASVSPFRLEQLKHFVKLEGSTLYCAQRMIGAPIEGYALAGKGRDLLNVLHTIECPPQLVLSLVSTAQRFSSKSIKALLPAQSPLLEPLSQVAEIEKKPLGFLKIIHPGNCFSWLNEQFSNQGSNISLKLHLSDQRWSLNQSQVSIFDSDDLAHVLQLFFGPWDCSELQGLSPKLQATLNRLTLPVNLWIDGLDSV